MSTKTFKIKQKIDHTRQGDYFSVAFEMPKDVASFTVRYNYPKNDSQGKQINIVDIGVADNNGSFVGWAGSTRQSVTVGESYSSDGFLHLPLLEGKWEILVGAYKIAQEGCEVEFEVELCFKELQLFFGDLHVHSTASDGKFKLLELVELARQKQLDFLAVTDHNVFAQNMALPTFPDLTLIEGVEWTLYKGHVNIFGLKNPFQKSFFAKDNHEAKAILDYAKSMGGLISKNHPFDPTCPYKWDFEFDFDLIEVTNGPMRPCNVLALKHWDELLKKGKRVFAVGGSDFHSDGGAVCFASPTTAILSRSRSQHDLLNALKNGRCFVTDKKGGVVLDLRCGEKTVGDTVKINNQSQKVSISATNVAKGHFLQVCDQTGEIARVVAETDGQTLTTEIEKSEKGFVRAVVATSAGIFLPLVPIAISNPIFFE